MGNHNSEEAGVVVVVVDLQPVFASYSWTTFW